MDFVDHDMSERCLVVRRKDPLRLVPRLVPSNGIARRGLIGPRRRLFAEQNPLIVFRDGHPAGHGRVVDRTSLETRPWSTRRILSVFVLLLDRHCVRAAFPQELQLTGG